MAQAAVIIHSGTYLCDFPSTFAVCPSMLGSNEVTQIRKQVLAATRSIDDLKKTEVRYMVYTCGEYAVAGMVSHLKNLADNDAGNEKFFTDAKGRSMYTFVGFVFQTKITAIPLINKKILWENFKTYMEPIWERTLLDTQLSEFKEVDFSPAISKEPTSGESISGMTLYTIGAEDASIFSYWLGQALKGKSVSFCSNVTDFKVVKDKPFNIITTTANVIERIRREVPSPYITPSHSAPSTAKNISTAYINQKKTPTQPQDSTAGQSSKNMWLIAGVGLIILMLVVLLLR